MYSNDAIIPIPNLLLTSAECSAPSAPAWELVKTATPPPPDRCRQAYGWGVITPASLETDNPAHRYFQQGRILRNAITTIDAQDETFILQNLRCIMATFSRWCRTKPGPRHRQTLCSIGQHAQVCRKRPVHDSIMPMRNVLRQLSSQPRS